MQIQAYNLEKLSMEVNFIIILVIIVIGFSIPIVICGYVFLLIWGPKPECMKASKDESSLLEKDRGFRNVFSQGMAFPRNFNLLSGRGCPHCKLIDSGDVAMYGVTCPECGEVPPSKKHLYPNLSANRGIGKMLMQVQQSALAPMAVVASDATDNQTSNTSGTSLVNTTVNVHPGV